jgi:hypothetical protein
MWVGRQATQRIAFAAGSRRLRHDATPHIVPIYQFDISGRGLPMARLTRELR